MYICILPVFDLIGEEVVLVCASDVITNNDMTTTTYKLSPNTGHLVYTAMLFMVRGLW